MNRFRPPRPNLRMRLTLIYASVFAVAGLVLVTVMYTLVAHRVEAAGHTVVSRSQGPAPGTQLPDPGQTAGEFVTAFNTYNDGTLSALLRYSLLTVLLLLVAATGAGWLVAGRTLRPLQQITATARRVADDRGLHQRIALAGPPDELKELADTFDAMLERLDQAFSGQRRFVANASHELRTPLAINRTLLEVALDDPDVSADLRVLGRNLLATNERSEQLIDGLLTLASSETQIVEPGPVDLADVGAQAQEQVTPEAAGLGVDVRGRFEAATVPGDGILLERLALNLLQNGLRHNVSGGWVEVVTGTLPDGRAELAVANTGPPVAPYEVPALFEPFRRLRDERTAGGRGVGLGLSIVRSVARAHGGEVVAAPRPGGGLIVRVFLPGGSGSSRG